SRLRIDGVEVSVRQTRRIHVRPRTEVAAYTGEQEVGCGGEHSSIEECSVFLELPSFFAGMRIKCPDAAVAWVGALFHRRHVEEPSARAVGRRNPIRCSFSA